MFVWVSTSFELCGVVWCECAGMCVCGTCECVRAGMYVCCVVFGECVLICVCVCGSDSCVGTAGLTFAGVSSS